jgi:hypothetical protein
MISYIIQMLLIYIPFIIIEILVFIERLCGSGWLILKGAYKRMGSVALIY